MSEHFIKKVAGEAKLNSAAGQVFPAQARSGLGSRSAPAIPSLYNNRGYAVGYSAASLSCLREFRGSSHIALHSFRALAHDVDAGGKAVDAVADIVTAEVIDLNR